MSSFTKIFVGGRGKVFALDKQTGKELWKRELKPGFFKVGSELVSLLETADCVYAFSYGTLYRLSKDDGDIEWSTVLPDLKHHVGLLAVDGFTNSIEVTVGCDGDSSGDGGGDGGD